MKLQDITTEHHYGVSYYPGISFYFHSAETEPDEDTEWTGYEVETGMARMVMVGDDRVHIVDPEDISEIPEDSFCRSCGQIGCGCNVYV